MFCCDCNCSAAAEAMCRQGQVSAQRRSNSRRRPSTRMSHTTEPCDDIWREALVREHSAISYNPGSSRHYGIRNDSESTRELLQCQVAPVGDLSSGRTPRHVAAVSAVRADSGRTRELLQFQVARPQDRTPRDLLAEDFPIFVDRCEEVPMWRRSLSLAAADWRNSSGRTRDLLQCQVAKPGDLLAYSLTDPARPPLHAYHCYAEDEMSSEPSEMPDSESSHGGASARSAGRECSLPVAFLSEVELPVPNRDAERPRGAAVRASSARTATTRACPRPRWGPSTHACPRPRESCRAGGSSPQSYSQHSSKRQQQQQQSPARPPSAWTTPSDERGSRSSLRR